jgi:FtsH-binding integral membrane protein
MTNLLKYLPAWLIAMVAIFAPEKAAICTALVLILIDLVTGVWAAKKRGEAITSSGLKTTIYKIVFYELAICLGFLAQTYLTGTVLPVCNLITSVIGLTEMTSILENLQTINPNISWASLISKFNTTKDNT